MGEEGGTAEIPDANAPQGSFYMPVGLEPNMFEPECMTNEMQPDHEWSPMSSHSDWEGLGAKRGVQPSCNGQRSLCSQDLWKTSNQSKWHQTYEKSPASPCDWENQGRRWDEPWGM